MNEKGTIEKKTNRKVTGEDEELLLETRREGREE